VTRPGQLRQRHVRSGPDHPHRQGRSDFARRFTIGPGRGLRDDDDVDNLPRPRRRASTNGAQISKMLDTLRRIDHTELARQRLLRRPTDQDPGHRRRSSDEIDLITGNRGWPLDLMILTITRRRQAGVRTPAAAGRAGTDLVTITQMAARSPTRRRTGSTRSRSGHRRSVVRYPAGHENLSSSRSAPIGSTAIRGPLAVEGAPTSADRLAAAAILLPARRWPVLQRAAATAGIALDRHLNIYNDGTSANQSGQSPRPPSAVRDGRELDFTLQVSRAASASVRRIASSYGRSATARIASTRSRSVQHDGNSIASEVVNIFSAKGTSPRHRQHPRAAPITMRRPSASSPTTAHHHRPRARSTRPRAWGGNNCPYQRLQRFDPASRPHRRPFVDQADFAIGSRCSSTWTAASRALYTITGFGDLVQQGQGQFFFFFWFFFFFSFFVLAPPGGFSGSHRSRTWINATAASRSSLLHVTHECVFDVARDRIVRTTNCHGRASAFAPGQEVVLPNC